MKNILKKLIYIVLLFLSPLATLALLGTIYVIGAMLGGMNLLTAVNSFKTLILSFMPYFPYLTIIPAVLVLSALFLKNKNKAKNLSK